MRHTLKKGFFGYKRDQVEACLDALDHQLKQQQEDYEARIKQVVEENIQLAVELKVARSGYKDSAELMMSAQSRVRDLERYLEVERQRVGKLEQQMLALKQSQSDSAGSLVQTLKDRITALETISSQAEIVKADKYGDGTRFERTNFVFPEGIDAADKETDGARGVMYRLYHLRAQD